MNVCDPLWSNVTAIKQSSSKLKSETGPQKSFLLPNPWNICSRVNKCSTEMVHTGVEGSATNVSQWQVLALRG